MRLPAVGSQRSGVSVERTGTDWLRPWGRGISADNVTARTQHEVQDQQGIKSLLDILMDCWMAS